MGTKKYSQIHQVPWNCISLQGTFSVTSITQYCLKVAKDKIFQMEKVFFLYGLFSVPVFAIMQMFS